MDLNGGNNNKSIEHDETDWFGGDYFSDDEEAGGDANTVDDVRNSTRNSHDLCDVMKRLGHQEGDNVVEDYKERTRLVAVHMGSMALCRGERGEMLREVGAIHALLATLTEILSCCSSASDPREESTEAILLATACFGAIRDLACGSAGNRTAVRTFSSNDTRGLELLGQYLRLYDKVPWEAIASPEHLSLLTNIIGALRNVTHSAGDNCAELHMYGVTSMLSWRLLHSGKSLPDPTQPWREAAFRAGGTLINMAEKCSDCAMLCARDPALVHILIESWGGAAGKKTEAPFLHVGLAAILKAAKIELPDDMCDPSWNVILANEQKRKKDAQREEEKRKQTLLLNK